jgi:hypothetical protein
MARKPHTIFVTFAAVVVMAVFVAITTWAAVPTSHSDPAAPTSAKGAIYRPALWKVYWAAAAWKRAMTDRTEELRETAAQCVALARSTTDPAVRAALTIMAQKLYDVANHRSAEYEMAQREFNDRQMLQQFPVQQPQSTMQQQQQIQPKKEK